MYYPLFFFSFFSFLRVAYHFVIDYSSIIIVFYHLFMFEIEESSIQRKLGFILFFDFI